MPAKLEDEGLSAVARSTTAKGGFALFTKHPLPQVGKIDVALERENYQLSLDNYQDAQGNRKIVRLKPDQLKLLQDYEKSYLHSVSFSGFFSQNFKEHFWDGAFLLPVYYDEKRWKWGIAWGVILSACSRDARSVLNGLMQGVCDGEMGVFRSREIIYKLVEDLQLPVSQAYLEDPIVFLTLFPMIDTVGEEVYSLQNINKNDKAAYLAHKLPGDLAGIENALQPKEIKRFADKSELGSKFSPYSVPTEWLQLGLLVSKVMPQICDSFLIFKMQNRFTALAEIPAHDLSKAFPSHSTEQSKRLIQFGIHLLKYLLMSDLIIRKQCTFSGTEGYDVGLLARHQGVIEFLSPEDTMTFRTTSMFSISLENALNRPFIPSYEQKKRAKGMMDSPLDRNEMDLRVAGNGILALLAVGYTYKGVQWARRCCTELGIIDGKTVLDDIEGGTPAPWSIRYQWEKPRVDTPRKKQSVRSFAQNVHRSFGYKFNVWQRLGQVSAYSLDYRFRKVSSKFRALDILGFSLITFLISDYCMKKMPSLQQTDLNRLLNPFVLQEIMGRIFGECDLDSYFMYDRATYSRRIKGSTDQLRKLKPGKLTRYKPPKLWVKFFQALVAGILIDSGFNLDAVRSAITPALEPYLKEAMAVGESELCSGAYKRYIPTHIVPKVYENSIAQKEVELHVKIIRFSEPLAEGSQGVEHGFFVLTGKKLPTCPSFDINFSPDLNDKPVKVTIQDYSKDLRSFTALELGLLEDFQFKFFENIAIPFPMVIAHRGVCEKRYSVLPALHQVDGACDDWEVDWHLVQHFVNGTAPEAWKDIVKIAKDSSSSTETILDLELRVRNDPIFEVAPRNWVPEDMFEDSACEELTQIELLMQSLIWKTPSNVLVWVCHLESESMSTEDEAAANPRVKGLVLNSRGVMNYSPNRPNRGHVGYDWSWTSLPVEKCIPTPMSVGCFRRASALPTVLHRLEGFLLADDFRVQYSLPQQLPLSLLTTALTCQSAQDLDPELLISIGTAVIKYVAGVHVYIVHEDSDPGRMTRLLSTIVQGNLAPVEHRQRIAGHLTTSGFNPHKRKTAWHPPGTEPFYLVGKNEEDSEGEAPKDMGSDSPMVVGDQIVSRDPHLVSDNLVDTHVKAVVGALFLQTGLGSTEAFLDKVGVIKGRLKARNVDFKRVQHSQLLAVEKALNYEFKDMRILAESLVHRSMNAGRDYDRLEFLGDLALECLAVQYILERHKDASQGQVFSLKSVMVGNETLARLAMSPKLALHHALVYSSKPLRAELQQAEKALNESEGVAPGELGISLPKVCSDIFESIVGAVLVDCGFRLEVVWKVFYPLFESFTTKWVDDPDWLWERDEKGDTSIVT